MLEIRNRKYTRYNQSPSVTDDTSKGGPTPEVRGGSTSRSSSYSDRAYTWLSRNGLYVETGISIVAIALGTIAIPFLAFGSLAAIGVKNPYLQAEPLSLWSVLSY